jgi:hypothetical protein
MEDKTIRTIPFDEKSSSYPSWSRKFVSLCAVKGGDHVLTSDQANMLTEAETLDLETPECVEKSQLLRANRLTFSMLMISYNVNITLRALTSAISYNWIFLYHCGAACTRPYKAHSSITQCSWDE